MTASSYQGSTSLSAKVSLAGAILVALGSTSAMAMSDANLVIVTSFSNDVTDVYEKAFEEKYPGVNVEVLSKKTTAGIKYLQETASNNKSDIFWASAPDAFEVLKDNNLLAPYQSSVTGIPETVGSFPINDPDGFYKGFALSGYGIMWNTRYMKAKKLPMPNEWQDLAKPIYHNHVGMSAPSRSGTTHLTVEAILQGEGWDQGWETLKAISGNFKTVTERSFGVPDGVNSGAFGLGIVIDFFGLSSKASGFPVEFHYPTVTALVPANVGIVKDAPNSEAAAAFVDFLLSEEGQALLLDKKIQRLPVNPAAYASTPEGFPNPFTGEKLGTVDFDLDLSKSRYNVVNSLFDVMITYRLDELREATEAIQEAEAKAEGSNNEKALSLIAEAKRLVSEVPVTASQASNPEFAAVFTKKRKKATDSVGARQAEIEQAWDKATLENYNKATELAEQASSIL
ncbi:ABC transporter substrate-binding protein [Enterovibrio paralichthyis]|uniref:ABC transporter substrate-binding protein n=1 Tax=Enterovibrio paralichthyis TaxID=2853805 RepID=UPI001C488A6E|nr:extracellular solute-binding protein [Enterovibrio paralichthyis]MBV7299655.1 extracellular solute-binding protein [Enterovibrio paralichthyis]